MKSIARCIPIVALAGAAAGQDQPACLVSLGTTLHRVIGGNVEVFPNQPGQIIGMTVIPVGSILSGCNEGDVVAVENAEGGRFWRIDNARSGTPQMVQIGNMPTGVGVCDIALAHQRFFGIAWGATFYEFATNGFAQVGPANELQPTTAGIGGMVFEGASWYVTNGNTNRLVRIGDPPSITTWTAVGDVGVDFDNSDLEMYHGQVWGALHLPGPGRLVIGTLDRQTAQFTQVWDVAAAADEPIGLAAFNPSCIGIDVQPVTARGCLTSGTQFSVVPAGVGPFTYQWQFRTPAGVWITLGNDPFPIACGGMAYAIPASAATTQIRIVGCAGDYAYPIRCIVSNACGSITSSEAIYKACYVNCDCSTTQPLLTANDFQCFLNAFASGSTLANCDGFTVQPILTANDFLCFLNVYAAGCP